MLYFLVLDFFRLLDTNPFVYHCISITFLSKITDEIDNMIQKQKDVELCKDYTAILYTIRFDKVCTFIIWLSSKSNAVKVLIGKLISYTLF
jgi:hypothetical protein